MITKMNKLTLLVYHKEYIGFLERLREVGVVHIAERESGSVASPELERQLALANNCTRALKRLEMCSPKELQPAGNVADALPAVERMDTLLTDIEQQRTLLQVIEKDMSTLAPWGDFDYSNIEKLKGSGYEVNFFVANAKGYDTEWEKLYNAIPVSEKQSRVYFVTVTHEGAELELDAEAVKLPAASLSSLQKEYDATKKRIEEFNEALKQLASASINTIKKAHEAILHDIEFTKVSLDGTKVTGNKLMLLEGWVPEDSVEELKSMLDNSGAFYEMRKARRGDKFPVKLKNNAFTRMYEVLTKMYGMPSETDFDPTPILAPFFSLFFAFCMGDAGYGLVLIALGFILKKKMKDKFRGMMNLVITLGIFTTVMGALFGTFFGMNLLDSDLPQSIKDFMIAGDVTIMGATYNKQMILALGIGIVHISIAMTVKAINSTVYFGFKESLSVWGWWLVVVGGAIIGTLTFLSVIPGDVSKWVFIVVGGLGAVGIYILNNLRRNILANIGAGLWDTYNMASGLLGDILSYIRLFALGLAGGMLGQTFNSLAMMVVEDQEGFGAVLSWIGFGLIIIFGHILNIAMSCLSAFVHPLRLTFVEYFKNAGYDGKGVEYKPFKKNE